MKPRIINMRKLQSKDSPLKISKQLPSTESAKEQEKLSPLDFKIILGDEGTCEQLAKIVADFEFKSQKIQELASNSDLDFKSIGKDTIIRFDFLTQEGREKEAIEYFENGLDRYPRNEYDNNLSPLQNWFVRPTHEGKLQLFESKRKDGKKGVTLLYRLYTDQMDDLSDLRAFLEKFEESAVNPDLHLEMVLKGQVDTYKKNRIRIRMDYIKAHIISKEFKLKDITDLMKIVSAFGEGEEAEMIMNNPAFKLLERSQIVQGTVKMGSLRKMLELYKIGTENSQYPKVQKESPQIIKGLFKSEVRFTFIYQSRYGIVANFNYQSQSILIRLLTGLKKYSQLFQ